MSDALFLFLRLNLATALAVALVLALRLPLRRLCGAQAAYGLWSLVPLAALAMLAPARVIVVDPAAPIVSGPIFDMAPPPPIPTGPAPGFDAAPLLVALWLVGAAISVLWLLRRQAQFSRAIEQGRAGPAVVGVLRPRIVVPADFRQRYTAHEQRVILAHEEAHVARQDSRINGAMALARCLGWFNPLLHLAGHYLRIDQELACDARVMTAHPSARRAYAEAMLKAQLAARPLPLGCYWPAEAAHPLAQRIAFLARARPSRRRRRAGALAVIVLGLAFSAFAWAARPVRLVVVPPPPSLVQAAPAPDPVAPAPRPTRRRHAPAAVAVAPSAAETTLAAAEPTAAPAPAPEAPPAEPDFLPRVRGAAERSSVEPGKAVRVVASMTDLEGNPLVTDLTAFGSQALYRAGYIRRAASRYTLFTSVRQEGERLWVTVSVGARFAPASSGTIPMVSGGTGKVALPDGQIVTVSATIRPETPEETAEGDRALRARALRADAQGEPRFQRLRYVRFTPDPFQCGRRGAVC